MSLPKLNTPTFELELPSTGQVVKYRPFLVREHKILLAMAEADNKEVSRIVVELIDACTFNKLDVSKLTYFDIEYVFLKLRSKSIGENVDIVVNCGCGEKIDTSFNIDDLVVEKDDSHSRKIMLSDDLGVEMSYPNFSEVVEVYQTNNAGDIIDLIIRSIKGIFNSENYWETKDQEPKEVEDFINTLTKAQFDKIEKFFVTAPKIVQVVETDCPKCGAHNVNRVEGLQNFFV